STVPSSGSPPASGRANPSVPRSAMSGLRRWLAPRTVVRAHCDIPCGVYDPQQARIEAESCYKIIQKYNDSSDELFRTRCIAVKEERADLAKHHIDVMWHDYFK